MSEAVEILIKADDQASQKFATTAENMDKSLKRVNQILSGLEEPADRYAKQLEELNQLHRDGAISAEQFASAQDKISAKMNTTGAAMKDVGGNAKKTTELVGTLAQLTGNTELGSFASQLAGATEKISSFGEVSKAGKAGALAFKLGLVALAATIGSAIGKAIGDVIFETKKFTRELERAKEASKELEDRLQKTRSVMMENAKEDIELIRDPDQKRSEYKALMETLNKDIDAVSKNVTASQKAVDEWADSWQITGNQKEYAKQAQEQLENDKARLAALRDERDELQKITSERARQNEEIAKANEAKDKSEAYIAQLKQEVEYLAATKEEQLKLDAARNTTIEDRGEAERLLKERDAIIAKAEAQKELEEAQKRAEEERAKAAEKAIQDAEREKERIEGVIKSEEQKIALQKVEQDERNKAMKAAAESGAMESRIQDLISSGIDENTAKKLAESEVVADAIVKAQEAAKIQALITQGVDEASAKRIAAAEAEAKAGENKEKFSDQISEEAEKEKQRIAELIKAENERLALKKIELEQGKEAARVQALMNQGVDEVTAKKLAADEAALEKDKGPTAKPKETGPLQASESRLLTRGEGTSPLDKTNELLTSVRDVMAQAKEVNAAQLAEQRRIAENTGKTQQLKTIA